MTFGTTIPRSFISGKCAEGGMTKAVVPDALVLAGALTLLAAVIALPLWG